MVADGHFGQQNGDIRATLALSQNEAAYGTTRVLTLSGGRIVHVNIPAGTYTGQEIRLEGQGEPTSKGAGALILTIAVAPAENFGPQFNSGGTDTPTEFMIPPPPPPPVVQPSYPGIQQGGDYANYPGQGGQGQTPGYFNQQVAPSPLPSYTPYVPNAPPPYYNMQGQPRRQSSRRPLIATILLAALALVIIISGLFYYTAVYVPNQQHAQATATVQSQLTGTTQAYATGTAQTGATATSQVGATNTAVAIPQTRYDQTVAKVPILSDPLSKPDTNNWETSSKCVFKGGTYHISESNKGYFYYCAAKATNFSNFGFQVKMTFLQGNLGGLLFRADADNYKFYLLRIDRAGRYDMYLYTDREANHAKKLGGDVSSLINTNLNEANLIAVIARGSVIDLYINSKYVTTITDSSLTSGQIGLFAENNTSASEVSFEQAQVWNA